eukprot:c5831_g1_i1.p1 GENE.c5831_g1_i1~~c5831_g1_i1.p1  ORF type:complete len:1289 (+),score=196.02 c5831_g1_i1:22-3888(+)
MLLRLGLFFALLAVNLALEDEPAPVRSNPRVGRWKEVPPVNGQKPPMPRYGHTSVAYGDSLIIYGGTIIGADSIARLNTLVLRFEIGAKLWSVLKIEGISPPQRTFHGAVVVDDDLYVFGGRAENGTVFNDVWRLSLTSLRWHPLARQHETTSHNGTQEYPAPRESFGMSPCPVGVPGPVSAHAVPCFLVFGGVGTSGTLGDMWRFDLSSLEWTNLAAHSSDSPAARSGCSLSLAPPQYHDSALDATQKKKGLPPVHDEAVVLFGGSSVDSESLNDMWAFHLTTSEWAQILGQGDVRPPARDNHASVVYDGRIFVFGGISAGPNPQTPHKLRVSLASPSLWSFSFVTNHWQLIRAASGLHPLPRVAHTLSVVGGTLWLYGGQASNRVFESLWTFSLGSDCSHACIHGQCDLSTRYCVCTSDWAGPNCGTSIMSMLLPPNPPTPADPSVLPPYPSNPAEASDHAQPPTEDASPTGGYLLVPYPRPPHAGPSELVPQPNSAPGAITTMDAPFWPTESEDLAGGYTTESSTILDSTQAVALDACEGRCAPRGLCDSNTRTCMCMPSFKGPTCDTARVGHWLRLNTNTNTPHPPTPSANGESSSGRPQVEGEQNLAQLGDPTPAYPAFYGNMPRGFYGRYKGLLTNVTDPALNAKPLLPTTGSNHRLPRGDQNSLQPIDQANSGSSSNGYQDIWHFGNTEAGYEYDETTQSGYGNGPADPTAPEFENGASDRGTVPSAGTSSDRPQLPKGWYAHTGVGYRTRGALHSKLIVFGGALFHGGSVSDSLNDVNKYKSTGVLSLATSRIFEVEIQTELHHPPAPYSTELQPNPPFVSRIVERFPASRAMPAGRYDHAAFGFRGGMYVFGGMQPMPGGEAAVLSDMWRYDVVRVKWEQVGQWVRDPSHPINIWQSTAAAKGWSEDDRRAYQGEIPPIESVHSAVGGRHGHSMQLVRYTHPNHPDMQYSAILFGGSDEHGKVLDDLWEFNVHTMAWVAIQPHPHVSPAGTIELPPARSHHASTTLPSRGGSVVMIAGGVDNSHGSLADCWLYRVPTNTWERVAPLPLQDPTNPNRLIAGRRDRLALVGYRSAVYLFGGVSSDGLVPSSGVQGVLVPPDLWRWTEATNRWTRIAGNGIERPTGRVGMSVTSTGNFLVLFGGVGYGSPKSDLWAFKPNPEACLGGCTASGECDEAARACVCNSNSSRCGLGGVSASPSPLPTAELILGATNMEVIFEEETLEMPAVVEVDDKAGQVAGVLERPGPDTRSAGSDVEPRNSAVGFSSLLAIWILIAFVCVWT